MTWCLGRRLPRFLSAPLFGDRQRYGLDIQPDDPCWQAWQRSLLQFYEQTQKRSAGKLVNDAGYRVMDWLDLSGRSVLEIGPGHLSHHRWWRGRPESYALADINPDMLTASQATLTALGVPHEAHLFAGTAESLAVLPDCSVDVIATFYSLEHLRPLEAHLDQWTRLLRPGGHLIGAIPAEGGLAWGLGRYLTSRRWLKRNTTINPDKIICWEHCNFADDIITALDARFERVRIQWWPLRLPVPDLELVARFLYRRRP